MADNVTTVGGKGGSSPPPSTVIATDEIGGVHYQLIRLVNTDIDGAATTALRTDPVIADLLADILEELKINNLYLSRLTSEKITVEEIEE